MSGAAVSGDAGLLFGMIASRIIMASNGYVIAMFHFRMQAISPNAEMLPAVPGVLKRSKPSILAYFLQEILSRIVSLTEIW